MTFFNTYTRALLRVFFHESMTDDELVTVGDGVKIKDLRGTVRFVGEILDQNGTYYGIELSTPKGKNNGRIGNIRYFKCKINRGLFVRRSAISTVFPKKVAYTDSDACRYRIGINESIGIKVGEEEKERVHIATVRYIGTPSKANALYYGIEFEQSIGDSDGMHQGIRYFTTVASKQQCARFIKANSKRIVRTWPRPMSKTKRAYSHTTESSQSTIESDYDDETDSSDEDRMVRLNEYTQYYMKRHKSSSTTAITSTTAPKYYEPLNNWILNAQNADTFKKRYQSTRSLMEKIRGKDRANTGDASQAKQILNIFAEWLEMETHMVLRKHILQLLIPFANTSYAKPKTVWMHSSIAHSIAKSLITKQWTATAAKQGFASLVTRALIALYKLQLMQIKEWKQWIVATLSSKHRQSHIECWHFLSSIVELSVFEDKAFIWIQQDVETLVADAQVLSIASSMLLVNTHITFPCCLFVYAIAHLYHLPKCNEIYQRLLEDDEVSIYFESIEHTPYKNLFRMEAILQSTCQSCEQYKIEMKQLSQELNELRMEREDVKIARTLCNECLNLKEDGYSDAEADETDGSWYCVECWNLFNENKSTDKYNRLQAECNEKDRLIEEYEMNKIKMNRTYNILESKYSSKCIELDGIESKCVELEATHEKKYTEMKAKYDNQCKENVTLKEEYDSLVTEMTKTKDSSEKLMQQLTQSELIQKQQTNDLIKYKEMKMEISEREMQLKRERIQRMTTPQANQGNSNFRDEIKVLKKKNKRRMSQMQDIYEGEYEKLLREYQEYKQRYPPDTNDPNHQHEQTQSTTVMNH
eukprot:179590_1